MMQRDVLPHLDGSDYRVRLMLKALYSAYEDLRDLGLEEEARLLLERGTRPEDKAPRVEIEQQTPEAE